MDAWGFHLSNWALSTACVLAVAALARRLHASAAPRSRRACSSRCTPSTPRRSTASPGAASSWRSVSRSRRCSRSSRREVRREPAQRARGEPEPSEARSAPARRCRSCAYAGACLSKETGARRTRSDRCAAVACDASDARHRSRRGLVWWRPTSRSAPGYLALRVARARTLRRRCIDPRRHGRVGAAAHRGRGLYRDARLLVFPHELQVDFSPPAADRRAARGIGRGMAGARDDRGVARRARIRDLAPRPRAARGTGPHPSARHGSSPARCSPRRCCRCRTCSRSAR